MLFKSRDLEDISKGAVSPGEGFYFEISFAADVDMFSHLQVEEFSPFLFNESLKVSMFQILIYSLGMTDGVLLLMLTS